MITTYIAVGLGGALGAMLRFFLSHLLPSSLLGLPLPILFVNVLGCFLMGLFTELLTVYSLPFAPLKLFLMTGFLGGFTTFSAFAFEWGLLYQKNQFTLAAAYGIASFSLSMVFFFMGIKVARFFEV